MTGLHDATIALGAVGLSVRDLERSLDFYRRVIGVEVLERTDGRAALGVGDRTLLVLEERPGAARDGETAGLFHFALLLPTREALGRQLAHLLDAGVSLTGAADHHVSEAIYLDDPDGHGIEIYRDRPREAWYADGRFRMSNDRLDLEGILALGRASGRDWQGLEPDTVMGHVHLETCDLARAQGFYHETLGFDVMAAWPHAVFMSVSGYHHHLAVNDWNRRRRPAAPEAGGIGLLWYEIRVLSGSELPDVAATLPEGRMTDGVLVASDPNGIPIRFVPA